MRSLPALAALLLISPAYASQVFDDFESGANPNGWQWNFGHGGIVPSGGDPGAWLGSGEFSNLGAQFTARPAQGTPLADALASGELSSISFDIEQLPLTCDQPGQVGRLVLLLTNTHGTDDPADDDFVYTIGEAVPDTIGTWSHVTFTIPVDADALPRGWVGGHDGDPVHLRDGLTWPDMMASIDQIDVDFNVPFLDHVEGCWNVGVDSIRVAYGGDAIFGDGFDGMP
jgi:hypothetical protein